MSSESNCNITKTYKNISKHDIIYTINKSPQYCLFFTLFSFKTPILYENTL